MGIFVIGGVIGFVAFLAIVAAIPMWGQARTRRLWGLGVGIAAVVLGIASWPRPATGPGYFVVFNEWTGPVIAEVRTPLDTGSAYRLEPHEHGPFDEGWPSGTEVLIFTTDCRLVATSHIEGRYRGTVLKADGSVEVSDIGDLALSNFVEVDRCPQPPAGTGGA